MSRPVDSISRQHDARRDLRHHGSVRDNEKARRGIGGIGVPVETLAAHRSLQTLVEEALLDIRRVREHLRILPHRAPVLRHVVRGLPAVGTWPISMAKCVAAVSVSRDVPGCAMISTRLSAQIRFAKCIAQYFSGRPVAAAKSRGSSVEEFVAMIVCGRSRPAMSRYAPAPRTVSRSRLLLAMRCLPAPLANPGVAEYFDSPDAGQGVIEQIIERIIERGIERCRRNQR